MKGKLGIIKTICKLADDHGPTILTIGAIITEAIAIYAGYKASDKVVESENAYQEELKEVQNKNEVSSEKELKSDLSRIKINHVVRSVLAYKWAIGFGVSSAIMMFCSNKISGAKIAGLTAALALSEDKLKKLTNKVKEMLPEEEYKKLQNKIMQEGHMEKISEPQEFKAPFDEDDALFYDSRMDSLFESKKSQVVNAINIAEAYCARNHALPYNKWRGFLGLQDAMEVGDSEWNAFSRFSAKLVLNEGAYNGRDVWFIEYGSDPVRRTRR